MSLKTISTRRIFFLALLAGSLLVAQSNHLYASPGAQKAILADNYNVAREISVTGVVVDQVELLKEGLPTNVIRLRADNDKKKYIVELAPVWYAAKRGFKVGVGDKISVTGYPIEKTRAGKLKDKNRLIRLIPRTITQLDKKKSSLSLRDNQGKPLWEKEK